MTTVSLTYITKAVTSAIVNGPGLVAELVDIVLPIAKPSVIKLPVLLVIVLPIAAKVIVMAPEDTGLATTILPGAPLPTFGKVSEKATPLSTSFWFGFVMVNFNVETPFARIGVGANCFAITGGRTAVRFAVA